MELDSYVQMDTVKSSRDSHKTLLTMIFTEEKLFLAFLLNRCTKGAVRAVFNRLEKRIGTYEFTSVFKNVLTDRGSEFGDPEKLETGINGIQRNSIYYCDPNRSDQKGALEKNHEYIRYVLPKGTSFEKMTDKTTLLLLNHINSEKRDSLNGHSPYEVSRLLLDNRLHKALGLAEIPADEVTLIPALIK